MKHMTFKKLYMLSSRVGISRFLDHIPDRTYLQLVYYLQCGYWLKIEQPETYNEKLQWLKLYDRNQYYVKLTDKYAVKDIVKAILGSDNYLIKTLAIGDSFDDINPKALPNQFVIKCTHDSGSTLICKNKNQLNWGRVRRVYSHLLNRNYYGYLREWQYKNIKPRIIVEEFISDNGRVPNDYKFFCFDGKPQMVMVAKDRESVTKTNFYNMRFERLNLKIENPNFEEYIEKPDNFDEMVKIAQVLSKGIKHVRIDLYNISGHIYFGEMTFHHWGGFSHIEPIKWDRIMEDWIQLDI